MLRIKNMTLTHKVDLTVLIQEFSCIIHDGEKVAIIGEEGNGKSALLKAIYGEAALTSYIDMRGVVQHNFSKIGYLPQIFPEQYLELSVSDFFFKDLDPSMIDYRHCYRLMKEMLLSDETVFSEQKMKTLSGGEKIKIQILCMLLAGVDLLLLDEPTNDLDLDTIVWLEKFINASDKTIIFVTHDIYFLKNIDSSLIHIERFAHKSITRTTYTKLSYEDYIEERKNQYQYQLQVAKKQRQDDDERLSHLQKVKQKVHHQLNEANDASTGRLLAKKMVNLKSREKRYQRERAQLNFLKKKILLISMFQKLFLLQNENLSLI